MLAFMAGAGVLTMLPAKVAIPIGLLMLAALVAAVAYIARRQDARRGTSTE